jgi:hypothetical protein
MSNWATCLGFVSCMAEIQGLDQKAELEVTIGGKGEAMNRTTLRKVGDHFAARKQLRCATDLDFALDLLD